MLEQVQTIWLAGPRGSGKSRNGREFAEIFPDWNHFDIDSLIEDQTGKYIDEIVASLGWPTFRLLEHLMAFKLHDEKKSIISTGGGLFVNDILVPGQDITYGELNKDLISNTAGAETILLVANDSILRARIEKGERERPNMRPIFDPQEALRVAQLSPEARIQAAVDDSMRMYDKRRDLYKELTPNVLDTSFDSPRENAIKIHNLFF